MSYKLNIPESEDWRTDTDNPMINAFRELMKYNNQFQDDPYVGIFWYDTVKDELFGVYSVLAMDCDPYFSKLFHANVRTTRMLHQRMWDKESHHPKRGVRFKGDYTLVPRGRVFEVENRGFVVCVGSWINDYPQAKDEILYEFQLPDNTEFMIDSHWDLGHGWSDKEL